MEGIQVSYKVAILALVTLSSPPGTASHFQCSTPDDWIAGPLSIFPGKAWPNGIVIYELHTSLTPSDIIEIWKAFHDIQNKTCIRFVPRGVNDTSYVSIEHDDDFCGFAHVCQIGGYQFAKFGQGCLFVDTIVHELGHTMCLLHEMTMKDRDDYISFKNCSRFPPKDDFDTGGYLYDYTSQMHYECGWCGGGWPTMEGVTKCGCDTQNGLSVEDADKINELYDCQGCLSHRWRRTENLTDVEKSELVSFGKAVNYKELYLCRTYSSQGEASPGQYDLVNNICTVTFNGTEFKVNDRVQVFTVPGENTRKRYGITEYKENLVPVGWTKDAVTIYAAVAGYEDYEGQYGQFIGNIGKVYANDLSKAYFSIDHVEVTKTRFLIVGCY